MSEVQFTVKAVTKEFNRKKLFSNISFSISQYSSLAITGKNGSGKSTLVKILCGLLEPTKGEWELKIDQTVIKQENYFKHIGLVSPYLNLYEEFNGIENLEFISKIRGLTETSLRKHEELLEDFGLQKHRKKEVKHYSSGMKQRLKYCAALLHEPKLLFLDEPQSNLDTDGIVIVKKYMKKQNELGILIFATNDSDDLSFANQVVDLNSLNVGK